MNCTKKIPLFVLLTSLAVLTYALTPDIDTIDLKSLTLKNFDTVTFVDVGGIQVSTKVHKPKQKGAVTIFMNGVSSSVSFSAGNRRFSDPSLNISLEEDERNFSTTTNLLLNPSTGKHDISTPGGLYDVIKAEVENAPNCDQIIIAHSFGGPRAIAYAKILTELGLGDRIKGIIFIGSPLRGHPAVADVIENGEFKEGIANLKAKYETFRKLLAKFIEAYRFVNPQFQGIDQIKNALEAVPMTIVEHFVGEKNLANLKPGSDFSKKYLGINLARDPVSDASDIISYANFNISCIPVLPEHIKVGMIAGIQSDPMHHVPETYQTGLTFQAIHGGAGSPNGDKLQSVIRAFIGNQTVFVNFKTEGWFQIGVSFPIKKNDLINTVVSSLRGLSGLWDPIWAAQAARDVEKLQKILNDISTYYKYFMNGQTGTSDTLIPIEAQLRSISEIGGTAIASPHTQTVLALHGGGSTTSDVEESSTAIWGTDGRWEKPIVGGQIGAWYDNQIENPANTPEERSAWQQAKTNCIVGF